METSGLPVEENEIVVTLDGQEEGEGKQNVIVGRGIYWCETSQNM